MRLRPHIDVGSNPTGPAGSAETRSSSMPLMDRRAKVSLSAFCPRELTDLCSQTAEQSWQVDGLRIDGLVGSKFRQVVQVLVEVGRGDAPAFHWCPAKDRRDLPIVFFAGQPPSCFVGEIEWQVKDAAAVAIQQHFNPAAQQAANTIGSSAVVILRPRINAKVVQIAPPNFFSDAQHEVVVIDQADFDIAMVLHRMVLAELPCDVIADQRHS